MISLPRVNVLGVGISVLTLDSATDAVLQAIRDGQQGYVTVTGVHGVSECQSDEELLRIHNESLLSTPDGVPLTWMGRMQGVGPDQMSRVYGPDLMLEVLDRGQAEGVRHYFFGGREGVAELLREKLVERFPDAQIVGTYTPPFPSAQRNRRTAATPRTQRVATPLLLGRSEHAQARTDYGGLADALRR